MIIYGAKSQTINGGVVSDIQCRECGHWEHLIYGELGYFHIFWIPTFLFRKKILAKCTKCQNTISKDRIPSHLMDRIRPKLFPLSKILWKFSGLVLLAILITGITIKVQDDIEKEKNYLSSPMLNDYYVADFTKIYNDADIDFRYGILKVIQVNENLIVVQPSHVVYSKLSGAISDINKGKINKHNYFRNDEMSKSINQLQLMKSKGIIRKVKRL